MNKKELHWKTVLGRENETSWISSVALKIYIYIYGFSPVPLVGGPTNITCSYEKRSMQIVDCCIKVGEK